MDKTFIDYCRYYHGEDKNPYSNTDERSLLWDYEQNWCDMQRTKSDLMDTIMYDYNIVGLSEYESMDGTPVSLKAYLFNRYCHWSSGSPIECVEPFKQYYNEVYKKKTA